MAVIPIPTITITGNQTICTGSSTVLTASGGSTYVWTPATGLSNPWVSNPSASPTTNTSYTVTSSVNGCQGTGTFALNVTSSPTIAPLFTQVSPICSGANITGLPTTSSNGILGSWSPAINNTTTTNYTFTPNAGQCALNASMQIQVNNLPSATISANGSTIVCQGNSVSLNANTGIGLSYQWQNNGTNLIGETLPSLNTGSSGSYSVVVTDINNCVGNSQPIQVTDNPLPVVNALAGGNTTFCQGSSVILSANTGIGYTYQWQNNGTDLIGETLPSLNTGSSGSYSVVVTDINNCVGTSQPIQVTVNPLPVVNALAGGNTTFCQGSSVILSASTGIGYTYQWLNNGININNATSANFTASNNGSYSVLITDNNSCTATSNSIGVIVNGLPSVTLTSFGQVCDTLGLVQLTGGSPIGGTYAGTSVTNNAFNTSVGTGVYPISYSYTDNNGCSSSATQNLTVINCSNSYITELIESDILLYPNPAFDSFVIGTTENYLGKTFEIHDIRGRLIKSSIIESTKTHVSISDFAIGSYYIEIYGLNKTIKFVKQ